MAEDFLVENLGIDGLVHNETSKFGYDHSLTGDKIVSVSHFDYNGMKTYALHFSNPKINVLMTEELKGIKDGILHILNDIRNCESVILCFDPASAQAGGNLNETLALLGTEGYLDKVKERLFLAAEIGYLLNKMPDDVASVAATGARSLWGGGFELPMMGKLPMVAIDKLTASLAEGSLGIIPGYSGMLNAYSLSSRENAEALCLSSDRFSAEKLYGVGIVGKLVPNPGWENKAQLQKDLMISALEYLRDFHLDKLEPRKILPLRDNMDEFRQEIDYRTNPNNYSEHFDQLISVRKGLYDDKDFRGKTPISSESVRVQRWFLNYLDLMSQVAPISGQRKYDVSKAEALLDVLFYQDVEFLRYSINSKLHKEDDKLQPLVVDFSQQRRIESFVLRV